MDLQWPLDNIGAAPIWPQTDRIYISQYFGDHRLDYSQFDLKGHNGLDIAAPLGTPIKAAYNGYIVEQANKDTGFGLRITQKIYFKGKYYQLVYGHMYKLAMDIPVTWNWSLSYYPVIVGQVIGYVDSTGYSTGNHLHFGMYMMTDEGVTINSNNGYGGAIDPLPFLRSSMTVGFKIASSPTVYVQIGSDKLVPMADWKAFESVGGSNASIVTIPDGELAKFDVVDRTLFKSN